MRWIVLTLAVAGCAPSAPANVEAAPVATQAALIDHYDPDLLIRLMAPMDLTPGKRVEHEGNSDGSIELSGPHGELVTVDERHCASHTPGVTCAGLTLTGRIVTNKADKFDRLDYVNKFNRDQAAVAMFTEDGDIVVSDDIILDGGISEANLQSALQTFATVYHQHRNFLLEPR